MTLNLSECKKSENGKPLVRWAGETWAVDTSVHGFRCYSQGEHVPAKIIEHSGDRISVPEDELVPVPPDPTKPKVMVRKMWRGDTTDNLYECSRPYVRDDKPVTIIEIEGHGKEAERLAEVARRSIEAEQSRTPDE